MARNNDDWKRQEQDREQDEFPDRRRQQQRRESERGGYGSRAGWGGQGFSQGSFGSFGAQGERLYTKYGGQGYGAQTGYWGRETGGGMSLYNPPERNDYGAGAGPRGSAGEHERRRREYWGGRNLDRDREDWNREWGGQGFSGREGGWGGYGSYDREYRQTYERPDYGANSGRNPESYGGYSQERWREPSGQRGLYAGLGPRNWRRSDERITEDINERLTQHPDVDAREIEVEVRNCEVTLRGTVDERRMKRLAEDIAEAVSGVVDVHNEIKVQRAEERRETL